MSGTIAATRSKLPYVVLAGIALAIAWGLYASGLGADVLRYRKDVIVGAVGFDVLDVRLACLVKGGVAGIVDAVELHGDEAHLIAGAQVVGWAGMDPFAVQV